jgi:hypothetical protein
MPPPIVNAPQGDAKLLARTLCTDAFTMVQALVHKHFALHRFCQTPAEASVWIDALFF